MPLLEEPSLTFGEVDDLLYFTRVNEKEELDQTIAGLAQKYMCSRGAILSAAVDPESGNSVLHYCSANGFADLSKALLSQLGVRLEASGTTANKGREVIMVNRTNKQGNTPLHWAAYNGHLEVVKILIAAGADVWIKNSPGHLAMFEAERAEKSEVVQYLLEVGGERVERAGSETRPSAQDIAHVQSEVSSATNGVADMSMRDARPSG